MSEEDKCFKCGSDKIVSSVKELPAKELGWVCRKCYDELHKDDPFEEKYMYGREGFITENKTVWD